MFGTEEGRGSWGVVSGTEEGRGSWDVVGMQSGTEAGKAGGTLWECSLAQKKIKNSDFFEALFSPIPLL